MEKKRLRKIAVVGAESTGKSWLCEKLAEHYKTVWVPEFAREYFNESDIYNYTLHDLEIIAERQMQLEDEMALRANEFLFCDTNLITLKIWAELEFQKVPSFIADNLNRVVYDHYLITDNSLPWEKDALRQNKFSRDLIFEMNIQELKKSLVPYSLITGKENDRLIKAVQVVESLR